MSDITLPPERLPILRTDDLVEVVVCRGAPRCSEPDAGPCVFCVRTDAEHATVAAIEAELDRLHS